MTEEQKSNVRAWVAALRSGEYEQGNGSLRSGNKYCCLGVATDLCIKATGAGEWRSVGYNGGGCTAYDAVFVGGGQNSRYLGNEVITWLGIHHGEMNPRFIGDDGLEEVGAVHANDTLGWDFNHIADAIERTYLTEDDNAKE